MSSRRGPPSRIRIRQSQQQQEPPISSFLTESGTFRTGDFVVNRDGLRLLSETMPATTQSQDVNFTLEDLETIQVLGKGNSGVVQLAQNKWTGELYAVKVIQLNVEDARVRQLARELKINRDLRCQYVVVCFDAFYHNGMASLVLEYMDAGSLADILKYCKTIPEDCLSIICRQVLMGLTYLHREKHVVHRDLKPSNLLLNRKGEVKITDFGVSNCLQSSLGQGQTFVGTINYMSPERLKGQAYSYDSDVWSLGLVLLECALGYFPYVPPTEGWQNFYELFFTIVERPAPIASRDQFSPEFCSFISRCIQKEPSYRVSVAELLRHQFIVRYENQGINVLADFIKNCRQATNT